MLLDAHSINYIQRFATRKYCSARIALAFGIVPERFIAGKFKVEDSGTEFRFLQTEIIGIEFLENFLESFLANGSESVDIPRNQLQHLQVYLEQSMYPYTHRYRF